MARKWVYKYNGNTITVVDSFKKSGLYVNGELRDCHHGITDSARYTTVLDSGEPVSASVGGFFGLQCSLFVNHKLQQPIEEDD